MGLKSDTMHQANNILGFSSMCIDDATAGTMKKWRDTFILPT